MLWPASEDRAVSALERQLLDAIVAGELDEHLVAIADAIHARRELLHTVSSAAAIAQLCVGDTVMLNSTVRPRYLMHELAMITELDEHWVTLRLARTVGRFRDGELRCPPLAIRKVERTGSPSGRMEPARRRDNTSASPGGNGTPEGRRPTAPYGEATAHAGPVKPGSP
jgi:hypothetical protein